MTLNITTAKNGTDFSGGNSQPPQRDEMNNRDQRGSRAEGGQLRTGGDWALWRQLLAGLLLLAGLGSCPLWAHTNIAKAAPSSRRWLFVVETSKSMQRRADGVLGAVRGLLASDLNGQLQAGDTLGMWTFNEDLYAGQLPLQTWSPQAREEIIQRTVTFLKSQKYEKQARFSKVAPALSRVIKDSELITVILISSGDGKILGTAIDGRINEYYDQWRKQQQKAQIPFVIVLRAMSGQVADYSFNTAPWPVQLPPLAPEMRSADTAPGRIPKPATKTPPPAVPPLVVSEKEPQTEPAPTPKPGPAVSKTESPPTLDAAVTTNETAKAKPPEPVPPPVEVAKAEPPPTAVVATTTNEPVKAKPPEPVPPPVEVAKAEPPPAVPDMTVTESAAKPAPAPTPVAQPKEEIPMVPEVKPVEPAPAKPEAAPPPPAPTLNPESITIEPPKPSPAPPVTTVPTPASSPAHEDVPAAAAVAAATQPTLSATSSVAPRPSSLPTPPVQNATAVPAETLTSHLNIWIAGLVLAIVAAVSALLLIRRSHATPQGSLITRSFEREKKP
jgi:hypothetical protein